MSPLRGNEAGAVVSLVVSVSPCATRPFSLCVSLSLSVLPGRAHWGSPGGGQVAAAKGNPQAANTGVSEQPRS